MFCGSSNLCILCIVTPACVAHPGYKVIVSHAGTFCALFAFQMIHSYMEHLERSKHQHASTPADPSDTSTSTPARARWVDRFHFYSKCVFKTENCLWKFHKTTKKENQPRWGYTPPAPPTTRHMSVAIHIHYSIHVSMWLFWTLSEHSQNENHIHQITEHTVRNIQTQHWAQII